MKASSGGFYCVFSDYFIIYLLLKHINIISAIKMKTSSGGFYCVHYHFHRYSILKTTNITTNRNQLHTRLQYNLYWFSTIQLTFIANNLNKKKIALLKGPGN